MNIYKLELSGGCTSGTALIVAASLIQAAQCWEGAQQRGVSVDDIELADLNVTAVSLYTSGSIVAIGTSARLAFVFATYTS